VPWRPAVTSLVDFSGISILPTFASGDISPGCDHYPRFGEGNPPIEGGVFRYYGNNPTFESASLAAMHVLLSTWVHYVGLLAVVGTEKFSGLQKRITCRGRAVLWRLPRSASCPSEGAVRLLHIEWHEHLLCEAFFPL
jgi:hypothetical protein